MKASIVPKDLGKVFRDYIVSIVESENPLNVMLSDAQNPAKSDEKYKYA
jgi:hypothetical protein